MIIKPFEGAGGYTIFDNRIIDHVMPNCKPNTWKVICATLRKTVGWNKTADMISFSQYMELTGIKNRTTLRDSLQDALDMKYILRVPVGQSFSYMLNQDYELEIDDKPVQKSYQDQYGNRTSTSTETVHTKDIIKKEKKETHPTVFILAQSLAAVCQMDFEINKGRLLAEAKKLARGSPSPTPELIKQYYNGGGWWWENDWRGKKGETPTPATIRETWGRWQAAPPKGHDQNKRSIIEGV